MAPRFSTKYTDEDTDFVYYGLRYYHPKIGRFTNRDLIGEQGGLNLNGFVENNPVNFYDYLGMDPEDYQAGKIYEVKDVGNFLITEINEGNATIVGFNDVVEPLGGYFNEWSEDRDSFMEWWSVDSDVNMGPLEMLGFLDPTPEFIPADPGSIRKDLENFDGGFTTNPWTESAYAAGGLGGDLGIRAGRPFSVETRNSRSYSGMTPSMVSNFNQTHELASAPLVDGMLAVSGAMMGGASSC